METPIFYIEPVRIFDCREKTPEQIEDLCVSLFGEKAKVNISNKYVIATDLAEKEFAFLIVV